jgi:hypothetical protein
MADQEIITRPPSHPLATSLLAASILGTIGAIAFVWLELFGEYMPAYPPGQTPPAVPGVDQNWYNTHDAVKLAKSGQTVHDHYKLDFSDASSSAADLLPAVERELGVGSKIGDPSAGPGADAPVEAPAPTPEAPAGEGGGEATPPPAEGGGEAPPPAEGGGEGGGEGGEGQ